MKENKSGVSFMLSAVVLMSLFAIFLSPVVKAQEFGWGVDIIPAAVDRTRIYQGDRVAITATGPKDALIYVEIVSAETQNVVKRFPTDGTVVLANGVYVFDWTIPQTYSVGLYYLVLKDDSLATKDAKSFRIDVPTDGNGTGTNITVEEVWQQLQLLKTTLNRMERELEKSWAQQAALNNAILVLVSISIVFGVFAIISAFARRSPALKQFFWGEKESAEEKTQKEIIKLLRFFVRREIPTDFGDFYTSVGELASEKEDVKELTTYDKTCEQCGKSFQARHPKAKFDTDKCRMDAFKERQKKGEG